MLRDRGMAWGAGGGQTLLLLHCHGPWDVRGSPNPAHGTEPPCLGTSWMIADSSVNPWEGKALPGIVLGDHSWLVGRLTGRLGQKSPLSLQSLLFRAAAAAHLTGDPSPERSLSSLWDGKSCQGMFSQ